MHVRHHQNIIYNFIQKRYLRTLKCSKYQSNIDLHIKKRKKKNFCQFSDTLYYN